jgi:hypothetical protein
MFLLSGGTGFQQPVFQDDLLDELVIAGCMADVGQNRDWATG